MVVVAHVILVSAQVLLVLTLGIWTSDLSLKINNKSGTQLVIIIPIGILSANHSNHSVYLIIIPPILINAINLYFRVCKE